MNKHYLLIFFLLLKLPVSAQDGSYWQNGYNPGSFLTPGAAVASDNDSGLFYYNPALLALHPKTSVTVSANIYQYRSTGIKNGVGTGLDLKSKDVRIVPQIVSGTILFNRKRNLTIGYALINQPVMNYLVTQRQDKQMNVLDDSYSPGNEYYVGQYSSHNNTSVTKALLSAGLKLSDHWSAGISVEGQLTSQDYIENYNSRAIYNVDPSVVVPPVANVQFDYEISYWHAGLRFKGGLAFEQGPHHFGLLISSPLIPLKGNATLNSDLLVADLYDANIGTNINLLANGRQTGLKVKYKMPLSIAAGYTWDYGNGQLYFATEYFLSINNYNIVTPRNTSFIRPDTGSNNTLTQGLLQFTEERRSVINFALGGSYQVSKKILLLASLATNRTFIPEKPSDPDYDGEVPYTLSWNTYNCQLGGCFRRQKVMLRAGIQLCYGTTGKYLQPVNFDHPHEDNILVGNEQRTQASFFSAGLVLSYIHNF